MESTKRIPRRLFDMAMRKFRRELREVERLARSVFNIDEDEIELETDFENVAIATDVTPFMVPPGWEEKAAMILGQDGMLRLTGLRDTIEYAMASFAVEATVCDSGDADLLSIALSNMLSPPVTPHYYYYVQRVLTSSAYHRDPLLVIEVDFGFHTMSYWLQRAWVYLVDPGVARVVIVQIFPLRRSALAAGLWKRAAVALVLGRVPKNNKTMKTQQQESEFDVCILEEKSFGNAPLAKNIRQTLATVPTLTHAAPRGELQFDEPAYASVPIPMANLSEAHLELSRSAEEHPHLLTVSTDLGVTPWVVNLGEVLADALSGWMYDRAIQ